MVTLAVLALTAALIFGGAVWMWQTRDGNRWMAQGPASRVLETERGADSSASDSTTAESSVSRPAAKEPVQEFNVTGVVEGLGDPYAMINGSIVSVGETIGRATLTGIAEGMVTLRLADGKELVVRVER